MQFSIKAVSQITLEYSTGEKTSTLKSTDFCLVVPKSLDESAYLNPDGMPTKSGSKAITQCFIQGLVGSIHTAHQAGHWDSAEHLRFIMSELEKGFVAIAESKVQYKNLL